MTTVHVIRVSYPVPYTCQFASPDLVGEFLENGRPLQTDQLAYAQLDTHYLLPLRDRQNEELKALGRWEEAQESFAQLTSLEWREKQFDSDGFWNINGARTLSPKQMAVLRELFLYREQEAQRLDRPPFKVFDQTMLLALTRKQPTSLRALRSIRGME